MTFFSTVRIAHESFFELHRKLTGLPPAQHSAKLLAESARIMSSELPAVLADARALHARWSEQSVLDPGAAQVTLHELAVELDEAEPKVAELLAGQRQIASELGSLVKQASQ